MKRQPHSDRMLHYITLKSNVVGNKTKQKTIEMWIYKTKKSRETIQAEDKQMKQKHIRK